MRYVLDSSVAIKWVLPEPDAPKAVGLRDDFHNSVHELLAPDVFPIEIAHALTKAERRLRITPPAGWVGWRTVMSDCPLLHPYLLLLPRAYAIASAAHVGVYDCLYVALAEREGCQLVTGDARLVTNLVAQFPFIMLLASLP
jgi:predicted nucleic acid-binding protein